MQPSRIKTQSATAENPRLSSDNKATTTPPVAEKTRLLRQILLYRKTKKRNRPQATISPKQDNHRPSNPGLRRKTGYRRPV